ncbi:MAG: molybdopterin molybdotransferase MoeA [Firmicutes bacterium]|nr:molybdopterin molybdotransferase MoeA [Bacillota bacterium]
MEKFIDTQKAIELILSKIKHQNKEIIKLEDSFNRILASDIYTKVPIPNFIKSPFDGYCLKSIYTKGVSLNNPVKLKIDGTIKAGDDISLLSDGVYKIMTGAEVPEFCDLVIKKEDTDCGSDYVLIYKEGKPDENIIQIGEDVASGVRIVKKGIKIKPGVVAMLAAIGVFEVEVFQLPKIGLITSGDEIIDLYKELSPGKIYNSNKYALLAFINELGLKAHDYGVASDNIDDLKDKINLALEENDVIITTGGVSVGDFDYIQDVYSLLNIEKIFWSVKMKPGTPVLAGKLGDKLIISLPGSPAASLITYEVIAKPAIKYIMGYNKYLPKLFSGIMMDNFKKLSNITRFLRVYITTGNDGYEIHLAGKQNAGVLQSMLSYTALAKVINPDEPVKIGDRVDFFFVDEDIY